MDIPILQDIVIILGLSVIIVLIFQRLKLPSVLGFLITGLVAGPNVLKLIHNTHEIELIAEIGIIFLLFLIGIEFSLKTLFSLKKTVLFGGFLQVILTIAITVFISYQLGLSLNEAIFTGFLLSLSSTAIVLKILQERGEITSPHGRAAIAILIFQDIMVVPMMLLTPLLAGTSDNISKSLLILTLKVILIIVLMLVLSRYVVPLLFRWVVKSKSRELFILTVVVLCFSVAWLTSSIGLSLALGAFFAGLIISESDYSHQATANILPFREIFVSFFFVSVGILLDLQFFISHVLVIILLTIAVMLAKTLIVAFVIFILRYPARSILLTSLSLFQVGEFAFLLSATGLEFQIISQNVYQYFLAISILSMAVTPFIINSSSSISEFLLKTFLVKEVKKRLGKINPAFTSGISSHPDFNDHIIIIGYGTNGKNLSFAAKEAEIPFLIVELDYSIFNKTKTEGLPVVFGDACDEYILNHINVHKARVVVVAISDPEATKKIISRIRDISETVNIIVRVKEEKDIEDIYKKGADEIIPEQFETSIALFTSVLRKYLVPADEIDIFANHIRTMNYEILRNHPIINAPKLSLPEMTIATIPVIQSNNKIVGKSISESNIRTEFGVNVLAIKRNNQYITEITPDTQILQNDTLYIFGNAENISKINSCFKEK